MPGISYQTQTGMNNPSAMGESADGTKLYILNRSNNTLLTVNAATGATISTLSGVNYGLGMVLNSSRTKAYVNSYEGQCVYVVNLTAGSPYIEATISTGYNGGSGIAINPSDTKVYVAHVSNALMTVINTATNSVSKTISLPNEGVYAVEFSPNGQLAYLANSVYNQTYVVNAVTDTYGMAITTSTTPKSIVFHPSAPYAYVFCMGNSNIHTINTSTSQVVASYATGVNAAYAQWNSRWINIAKNGKILYVGNYDPSILTYKTNSDGTLTADEVVSTGTSYHNDTIYVSKTKFYNLCYNYNFLNAFAINTAGYRGMAWGGNSVSCQPGDIIVGVLAGSNNPTPPSDATLISSYNNGNSAYMAACYKIAKTNSESILWNNGTASSLVLAFKNAGKIGSYAVGAPGGYGFYAPNISQVKTDGSSMVISMVSGWTNWGVSLQPGDGTVVSTGWALSLSVRNRGNGAGGYFYTTGGAPSVSIAAMTIEIVVKDPAKTGFYFMFN